MEFEEMFCLDTNKYIGCYCRGFVNKKVFIQEAIRQEYIENEDNDIDLNNVDQIDRLVTYEWVRRVPFVSPDGVRTTRFMRSHPQKRSAFKITLERKILDKISLK